MQTLERNQERALSALFRPLCILVGIDPTIRVQTSASEGARSLARSEVEELV